MVNNRQNNIHGEAIIGLLIAEYSPTVQLANIRQLFANEHNFCKIFSHFVIKFPIFLDFFEFSWKNRQKSWFWRIIAEYSPAGEYANIRGEASTRPQLAKRIVGKSNSDPKTIHSKCGPLSHLLVDLQVFTTF